MATIVLASGSPRRQQLLEQLDLDFRVVENRLRNESYPSDLAPNEVPAYLSHLKSEAYDQPLNEGEILLTADTIVIIDGTILEKPVDAAQACRMLSRLSGCTHDVLTGVTLRTATKTETFTVKTTVTFVELSASQIDYYVRTYNPTDKAGGYGAQDWIGAAAIESINGSFYNVVGLPTAQLLSAIERMTVDNSR